MRYSNAREFVREYAENLSKGGLFIKDAYALAPLQPVAVRVELPGLGTYEVRAEVVHIIAPDMAAQLGRPAGAGLAIVEGTEAFQQTLEQYLQRLGQRKDHAVLIADESAGILLGSCGYRVSRVPLPNDIVDAVTDAARPIVGVIVPEALVADFQRRLDQVAAVKEVASCVHSMETFANIDDILACLDDHLLARLARTGS